jgi:hypothetical protein
MDYSSLIESIKNKTNVGTEIDPYYDTLGALLESMSKPKLEDLQSSNTTLFSDFFGQKQSDGKVSDFKINNLKYNKISKNLYVGLGLGKVKSEIVEIMTEYHDQLIAKTKWMAIMGLLERLLLQYDCYARPRISYSTQKQKSGKNTFEYILLRAPFYDLEKGKNEIRVYFNKIEDYPSYTSLDNLIKNNDDFVIKSKSEVQTKMRKIIDSNPIKFSDIKSALKQIESEADRIAVEDFEKKRLEWLEKHNFKSI